MPLLHFFAYVFLETLAFFALAQWIGLGWTLALLFGAMLFGMAIASFEVRRIMNSRVTRGKDGVYYMETAGAGKAAGNIGLTLAGGVMLSVPGLVTTVLGALLIFPPTRAVFRVLLTASLFRKVEQFGTRMYEQSPMGQHTESYGNFGPAMGQQHPASGQSGTYQQDSPEVIDEAEFESELDEWSKNLRPEDFNDSGRTTDSTDNADNTGKTDNPGDSDNGGDKK
ncbi:FxsA family protein [Corynebacterium camporealensis]